MTAPPAGAGGPVLQLLAGALQLWLRQQCQVDGDLQVQLEGSALDLLRGRLEAVRLTAERVTYRELRIEQVSLRSSPIQVRMRQLVGGQPLQLDQPFEIRGQLHFNPAHLSQCFGAERWQGLAAWLAQQLLGGRPPLGLQPQGQRLQISAMSEDGAERLQCCAELAAVPGGLAIRIEADAAGLVLPLDRGIELEAAAVETGLVVLRGRASVTP